MTSPPTTGSIGFITVTFVTDESTVVRICGNISRRYSSRGCNTRQRRAINGSPDNDSVASFGVRLPLRQTRFTTKVSLDVHDVDEKVGAPHVEFRPAWCKQTRWLIRSKTHTFTRKDIVTCIILIDLDQWLNTKYLICSFTYGHSVYLCASLFVKLISAKFDWETITVSSNHEFDILMSLDILDIFNDSLFDRLRSYVNVESIYSVVLIYIY